MQASQATVVCKIQECKKQANYKSRNVRVVRNICTILRMYAQKKMYVFMSKIAKSAVEYCAKEMAYRYKMECIVLDSR